MIVLGNAGQLVGLDLLMADATSFLAAVLRLYQNNPALSGQMILADFQQADFTGYPAGGVALTWETAAINLAGLPTTRSQLAAFAASTPILVTNTLNGWYLENPVSHEVLAAGQFDAPINVTSNGQAFDVLVTLNGTNMTGGGEVL